MSIDPDALLATFFPSPEGARGFYSTFEPAPKAMAIDPGCLQGRNLLRFLGLRFHSREPNAIGFFDGSGRWTPATPTLYWLGSAIFAGYWDGDGVALVTADGSTWYESTDVKCAGYWQRLTIADLDARAQQRERDQRAPLRMSAS